MKSKALLLSCMALTLCITGLVWGIPNSMKRVMGLDVGPTKRTYSAPTKKVWGLDISHHNANIKWEKFIGKDKPHFIYIKTTEGITHIDRKYKKNIKNARKHQIKVGSYHFFSYRSDGKKQAKHFYKHAQVKDGDLRPVLDLEFARRMPKIRAQVSQEIEAFILEYYRFSNQKPIIYTTEKFYQKYLKDLDKKHHFTLWIADYRGVKPTIKHAIWQSTDKHIHPALKNRVDYNVFHGNTVAFEKLVIR